MKKRGLKLGFTLVEVVIALAITAILLAAVFAFAGPAIQLSTRMRRNADIENVHNVFQNAISGELQNASNIVVLKNQPNGELYNVLKAEVKDGRHALAFVYIDGINSTSGIGVADNGYKYQQGVYIYELDLRTVALDADIGNNFGNSIVSDLAKLTKVENVSKSSVNAGAQLLFAPDFYSLQGWHFNVTPYQFFDNTGKKIYFMSTHIASYDTVKTTGTLLSRIGHNAITAGTTLPTGGLTSTDETSVVFQCYNVTEGTSTSAVKNPPAVAGRFSNRYIDTWYNSDEDNFTATLGTTNATKIETVRLPSFGTAEAPDPNPNPNLPLKELTTKVDGGKYSYALEDIKIDPANPGASVGRNPMLGLGDSVYGGTNGQGVLRPLPLPDDTEAAKSLETRVSIPLMIIYSEAFS